MVQGWNRFRTSVSVLRFLHFGVSTIDPGRNYPGTEANVESALPWVYIVEY